MLRRLIPLTVLMVFAAMAALACGGDEELAPAAPRPSPSPPPPATAPAAPAPTVPPSPSPVTPEPPTPITVKLNDSGGRGPFSFGPADLAFDVGETVSFTFVGESQFHTFTVEQLGIDVDVDGGETVSFQHTFDTPGTYTLICIPHEALGMVGTITVGPSTGGAAPAPAPVPPAPAAATAKTVKLDDAGGRGPFSFDPADLTFDAGETVDFTFVGESQFHTFTVADLGIDVDVAAGETVSFQHTFDTPGTYTLICIPHQSLGMVGTITVR